MSIQQAILKKIDESGVRESITQFWKQAVTDGRMAMETSDSLARPIFVGLQALIEKTIADEVRKGTIKSAVNIVHTPKPVNPFAQEIDDSEAYESDADFFDELKNAIDPQSYVDIRRKVLEDFIEAGGVVSAAYPSKAELTDEYQNNVVRLKDGLIDHPLEALDSKLSGATLTVTGHDGLVTVFSMNAHQMQTAGDGNILSWRLFFGDLKEDDIAKRLMNVEHAVDPKVEHVEGWEALSANKIEKALG